MGSRNTFTGDLLGEILSRLTVRRLLQLKCVSKSWFSLIGNNGFMKKHYQMQYALLEKQGSIPLFADKPSVSGQDDPAHFYLISKELENIILCLTSNLTRDSEPHFVNNQELFNSLYCMGVVNGIVLLHWEDENLGLWNSATREFKVVPRPRPNKPDDVIERMGIFFGMGFDPRSNDVKVVREIEWLVRQGMDWETTIINEMYSLRANSWKSVELPMSSLCMYDASVDGYFNGIYHWMANEFDNNTCCTSRIWMLTFNFSTESFKLFDPPPPACKDGPKPEWCISKYMEHLAVIFTVECAKENECGFETWIMSSYDADDRAMSLSWQHLLTIGPVPAFDGLCFNAFLLDGDILVTVKGGEGASITTSGYEAALYCPTTRSLKRLGLPLSSCLRYVESLFSLSH